MTLKGKTILVTGGAGFIGSHLVEALEKDNRVVVYDNFSSSVVSVGARRDILDEKKLTAAMKGVDIVFHLAVACVRLSLSEESFVHNVNATGTLSVLIAAKKSGVKRFIYISSSEVYGTAIGEKINESHPISPTTIYGMSKYIGELYTRQYNDLFGLPTIIIRPFNTYGPRSHFNGVYGEVIPRFVIRALNGKQPLIFGSGLQTRDFTYISDTVNGIIKASQSDKLFGQAVNIAYGQEISILEIAEIICKEIGLPFKPIMKPARPNDVLKHFADIQKARKILSYKPRVIITEGLKKYITWVKKTYPDPNKLMSLVPNTNW